MTQFHLAQVNIAVGKSTLDDPVMAGFVTELDRINTLADNSKGFVWRLQTEEGDATSIKAFDDERIILNLSVWESVADLKNYVYSGDHLEILKNKKEWFVKSNIPHMALWWIPVGAMPTVAEAVEKLRLIAECGETEEAFNFVRSFAPPSVQLVEE